MIKSWLITAKEIKSFVTDRADLAYSLLLPVAVFALLYGAFGGNASFTGTVHIVDEDRGEQSARLIDKLKQYDNLAVKTLARSEAERRLDRADLTQVVVIPDGFSEMLAAGSGKKASIIFRQRGNGGFEEQVTANMVRAAAEEMAQDQRAIEQVSRAVAGRDISAESIRKTVVRFSERERAHPIIEVRVEDSAPRPDPVASFLPGILTMFVLFSLSINSRVLVEEKNKGTLERLMTTRLSVASLYAGKFIAGAARALIQIIILLALAAIVFRIFTPATFALALVVSLVFSLTAAALGLLIGSLSRTEDQAIWFGVLATIVLSMLGGTFFSAPAGSLMHTLGRLSINSYANEAFHSVIARQLDVNRLLMNLVVLAGVALCALVIGRFSFKVLSERK